jgi:hypothetical protein
VFLLNFEFRSAAQFNFSPDFLKAVEVSKFGSRIFDFLANSISRFYNAALISLRAGFFILFIPPLGVPMAMPSTLVSWCG